ncbi:YfcE family phosphodiesterase [Pyrolobus fumarii]|nr:metallophosphoesterase [Pyrolobus fumarii]
MVTRILVMSDTHIPYRARRVPETMLDLISKLEYEVVVHAGDLCGEEVLEWIKSLGGELYVVSGNMDFLPLPESATFTADDVKIGVIHGHQVYPRGDIVKLTRIAKEKDVEMLISGHTHAPLLRLHEGVLHVNPGSLTGVWGGGGGSLKPSLAYITVNGRKIHVKIYEDRGGKVVVLEEREVTL